MQVKDAVYLSHSTVLLRKDGILEVSCKNDFEYDVEHIREILQAYSCLLKKGEKAPVLIVSEEYTSITSAGMKYSAGPEGTKYSKAEAFVIHSLFQKMLANFYLNFNKPKVPTRFFNEYTEAEKWLKNFL